ncbi:peroxidase 64-like isoform X1 [Cucurbita moschata]|uniref:Peroxidase n=1 Tax=Cucurbita moschata TaxID=3662 RepID=A0A6J1GGA2_CUCMO|nr:peroxidase 64-like isoform X1 [Cucurbita moschata]
MASFAVVFSHFAILLLSVLPLGSSLSLDYYEKTCPGVDFIVNKAVKSAAYKDKTVPAGLLRMHFHDCFIRVFSLEFSTRLNFFVFDKTNLVLFAWVKGCDASVLLNSVGNNKAEKDGPPNLSLHSFFVIDNAKKELESYCPGVVSCADIVALAARDAVVLSGGPTWDVPKGRKDGRISKASETIQLPSPRFNISQLQQSFSQRGLSLDDLVALSGAHTLGFAHCSSFEGRIRNFCPASNVDPEMNPSFAASLRNTCPVNNKAKNAGAYMDTSSTTFDNNYYRLILQKKALFSSDQALLNFPKTKNLVYKFASSKEAFNRAFVNSMIKMSSITGGQEIRKNCRAVN